MFLVGVGVTIAYTASLSSAPNPGHAVSTVGGYFSGDDSLDDSLAKFCQSDGTNCPANSGGITCSEIIDTGVVSGHTTNEIALPAECLNGGVCLYNLQTMNVALTQSALIYQATDGQLYSVLDHISAKNGDAVSTRFLAAGGDATSRLLDDYSGVETDKDKMTIWTWTGHRTKLIICHW